MMAYITYTVYCVHRTGTICTYIKKNKESTQIHRQANADKYKELNKIHNEKYRAKLKLQKLEANKTKAKTTIADAMKARKARKEMNDLKAQKELNSFISNIVDNATTKGIETGIKTIKKKKNLEAVKDYNLRKKEAERTGTPMTLRPRERKPNQ
jgi:hypothetical protein